MTGPITKKYSTKETLQVDVLSKGTNKLTILGQAPYKSGTVITVDGDAYATISASFKSGKTEVVLASPAIRNYILPSVTRTIRPVLGPGSSFQTLRPAHTGHPFTLVKSGSSPGILASGTDYHVSEGGLVDLIVEVGFGDILEAMYVARSPQPAGTLLSLNYAAQVAPNATNGILGQQLILGYSLYSPDTFFLRRESVVTFIPEVVQELQKSASSSSGPATASRSSLKAKDMGSPSLFFDEQHLANIDVVISRLLKFYNDLVNTYEDTLSNLDGRVVGGTSGKFRFDGILNNPPRTIYQTITNDLDDKVQIYVRSELTGFFTFQDVPVYSYMYDPSNLSRIYPTASTVATALNDKVTFTDFGKTIGSLNVSNLTSVDVMTSAPAMSTFVIGLDQFTFLILKNGDTGSLIPPFAVGMKVQVFAQDGAPDVIAHVVSFSNTQVILDIATTLNRGSIVQDILDFTPSPKHFYNHGKDLTVNFDNGLISNLTFPAPLSATQNTPVGNEIIQAAITFSNTETTPRRIPVLDGSQLLDSGRPSVPPLKRPCELDLLANELANFSLSGHATTSTVTTLINVTVILTPGQKIVFLNGRNAGLVTTVMTAVGTTVTTNPATPFIFTAEPGDFVVVSSLGTPSITYLNLLGILHDNVETLPIGLAAIGKVNSELTGIDSVIRSFGTQQAVGTGTVSGNVLTDSSANFATTSPVITTGSLFYIPSGPNMGLYKISAITSHTITVDPTPPYRGFTSSVSSSYVIIQPWSFLPTGEFAFATDFLSKTFDFYNSTVSWYGS